MKAILLTVVFLAGFTAGCSGQKGKDEQAVRELTRTVLHLLQAKDLAGVWVLCAQGNVEVIQGDGRIVGFTFRAVGSEDGGYRFIYDEMCRRFSFVPRKRMYPSRTENQGRVISAVISERDGDKASLVLCFLKEPGGFRLLGICEKDNAAINWSRIR
ncbi:MAG: hypothetical protein A3K19_31900 [Lentisphaerae bacterium RIFOXYB12_FULL_65_16]|nr:MAG: hypothetical protein A3K18_10680 [Lentisphaerae bacterium RIFOXYA12_64_32]OGV88705.1 MAG: hypothetical protein A3K19_31900 [Lentisphaerae bacterium RIFOXYB12_FULL_65_16]